MPNINNNETDKISFLPLGTGYLLPVLTDNGYVDVAYKLLLQKTFPSWAFMIENGATTMWEHWDSYSKENGILDPWDHMNSFNQYPLGAVGRWIYQYMAGIDTDEKEVGFKKIVIRPHIGKGINRTQAWHVSPRGLIEVIWEIKDNTFDIEVKNSFNLPNDKLYIILRNYQCMFLNIIICLFSYEDAG